jgi:hypothetical protein
VQAAIRIRASKGGGMPDAERPLTIFSAQAKEADNKRNAIPGHGKLVGTNGATFPEKNSGSRSGRARHSNVVVATAGSPLRYSDHTDQNGATLFAHAC